MTRFFFLCWLVTGLLVIAGDALAQAPGYQPPGAQIPPNVREFERQRRENDERYRQADRDFQERELFRRRMEEEERLRQLEAERRQLQNDRLEQQLRQPGTPVYVLPDQPAVRLGCRAYQPAYDQNGRLLGQICIP